MKTLKNFIKEDKNTHLAHIEDLILDNGLIGLQDSINFLSNLKNMLASHSKSNINLTVKWDGSPSIVCGEDPESKEFFIVTKSVFNKEPKLNFNIHDIYDNHPEKLADTLATIFPHLKSLNIKEIIQGDLLYTKENLHRGIIDNEMVVFFKPNTITYTVPIQTDLGARILDSQMGIVFHTTYTGKTIKSLTANFGANIGKYKSQDSVWITDAYYKDESGTSTLTENETSEITAILSLLDNLLNTLSPKLIIDDLKLKELIKIFNNLKIRQGKNVNDVIQHTNELINFIDDRYQIEINNLKSEKGKETRREQLKQLKTLILNNKEQLHTIFEIQHLLIQAKNIIIKKLETVRNIGTFIETTDGFAVTSHEGFICVDNMNNQAVKLVDRLVFSHANFNNQKYNK